MSHCDWLIVNLWQGLRKSLNYKQVAINASCGNLWQGRLNESYSHLCHSLPQVAICMMSMKSYTSGRNACDLWQVPQLANMPHQVQGFTPDLWHGAAASKTNMAIEHASIATCIGTRKHCDLPHACHMLPRYPACALQFV